MSISRNNNPCPDPLNFYKYPQSDTNSTINTKLTNVFETCVNSNEVILPFNETRIIPNQNNITTSPVLEMNLINTHEITLLFDQTRIISNVPEAPSTDTHGLIEDEILYPSYKKVKYDDAQRESDEIEMQNEILSFTNELYDLCNTKPFEIIDLTQIDDLNEIDNQTTTSDPVLKKINQKLIQIPNSKKRYKNNIKDQKFKEIIKNFQETKPVNRKSFVEILTSLNLTIKRRTLDRLFRALKCYFYYNDKGFANYKTKDIKYGSFEEAYKNMPAHDVKYLDRIIEIFNKKDKE